MTAQGVRRIGLCPVCGEGWNLRAGKVLRRHPDMAPYCTGSGLPPADQPDQEAADAGQAQRAGEFPDRPDGPELHGDPAADRPMTLRVHPDDDPRAADARRAVRTNRRHPEWLQVTGPPVFPFGRSAMVRHWRPHHWLVAVVASRDRSAEGSPSPTPPAPPPAAVIEHPAERSGDDLTGEGANLFR